MLSTGPPKPANLLYSTLHLQTDSSFTVSNCRKRDRLGVRCFRLGRLGCRVILPGENNITACIKDIWQQLCCTSVVKSLKPGRLNFFIILFLYLSFKCFCIIHKCQNNVHLISVLSNIITIHIS